MNARVLLLDEPTSSLTEAEVESLFELVRSLKARGLTTIFVSHRMSELFALADRVTILRDGRTVEVGEIGSYDPDRIIERMVGAIPAPATAHGAAAEESEPALRVHELSVPGRVHDATLTVAAGEAVGIAGLTGSGRTELLEAIFGMRRPSAGRVEVGGAELRHGHVAHAIEHGLAYVPGDRKSQGLVLSMSVTENLMMATTSRRMRLRVPSRSRERAEARSARGDVRDRRTVDRGCVPDAQRRQPAEGRHREMDAWLASGPPDGRADARCRRRREARDLPTSRGRA